MSDRERAPTVFGPIQPTLPVHKVAQQQAVEPTKGLQFLQQHDVFFCNQSARAVVERFLKQSGNTPLVLTFAPPEHPMWDKLFPNTRRSFIVVEPVGEHSEGDKPEDDKKEDEQEEPPNPESAQNAETDLQEQPVSDSELYKTNPFITTPQAQVSTLASQSLPKVWVETEITQTAKPKHYVVKHIQGALLQSQYTQQLEQDCAQNGLQRQQTHWAELSGTHIRLLPDIPQKQGYQHVALPIQSFIRKQLAYMGASVLGLTITDDYLVCPNGTRVALNKMVWRNAEGQTHPLNELVGLPDGRWVVLESAIKQEEYTLAQSNKIRSRVESLSVQLERQGWQRADLPKPDSVALDMSTSKSAFVTPPNPLTAKGYSRPQTVISGLAADTPPNPS